MDGHPRPVSEYWVIDQGSQPSIRFSETAALFGFHHQASLCTSKHFYADFTHAW
jgi:hypothetical protein